MHNITGTYTFKTPLYNGGANESNIILQKEQFLMQTFRKHLELIKVKKHYPVNDELTIDLSMDAVLLSKIEYDELLNKITNVKF